MRLALFCSLLILVTTCEEPLAASVPANPAESTTTIDDVALARAADAPYALVLTLTGNLHNRLTRGLPWDKSLVPAGVHVDEAHEHVISVDVRHVGGTAWIHRGPDQCGPADMAGKPVYRKRYVELGDETGNENGSGVFSVGTVSAAPPATVD